MANTREKLIELVGQVQDCGCDVTDVVEMIHVENDVLVDHLIANGVRLEEKQATSDESKRWVPVTEQEEPTENGTYLCHGYWFGSRRKQTETADFFGEWNIANNFILTHWMPLPEPPKGE